MQCVEYSEGNELKMRGPHVLDPVPIPEDSIPTSSFEAQVCPDGFPYLDFEDDGREPGFFYSVDGISNSGFQQKEQRLRFYFPNFSTKKNANLISYGHKPVAVKVSEKEYSKLTAGVLPFYKLNW